MMPAQPACSLASSDESVASASVRKAENLENVGRREGDVLRLPGSQRPRVTEPLLPQLLSGVIPDFG